MTRQFLYSYLCNYNKVKLTNIKLLYDIDRKNDASIGNENNSFFWNRFHWRIVTLTKFSQIDPLSMIHLSINCNEIFISHSIYIQFLIIFNE